MNATPFRRSEVTRLRQPQGRNPGSTRAPGLRSTTLRLLNEALAGEVFCVVRYTRHHLMACSLNARLLAEECLSHALAEQAHADLLAERIVQLGGLPEFSSAVGGTACPPAHDGGESLVEMMRDDLVGEYFVIKRYRGFIDYLGDQDPATRRMLEGILRMEEAHATDLGTLLQQV